MQNNAEYEISRRRKRLLEELMELECKEAPRMMQGKAGCYGVMRRHSQLHEWDSYCDCEPRCVPVEPAPKAAGRWVETLDGPIYTDGKPLIEEEPAAASTSVDAPDHVYDFVLDRLQNSNDGIDQVRASVEEAIGHFICCVEDETEEKCATCGCAFHGSKLCNEPVNEDPPVRCYCTGKAPAGPTVKSYLTVGRDNPLPSSDCGQNASIDASIPAPAEPVKPRRSWIVEWVPQKDAHHGIGAYEGDNVCFSCFHGALSMRELPTAPLDDAGLIELFDIGEKAGNAVLGTCGQPPRAAFVAALIERYAAMGYPEVK